MDSNRCQKVGHSGTARWVGVKAAKQSRVDQKADAHLKLVTILAAKRWVFGGKQTGFILIWHE